MSQVFRELQDQLLTQPRRGRRTSRAPANTSYRPGTKSKRPPNPKTDSVIEPHADDDSFDTYGGVEENHTNTKEHTTDKQQSNIEGLEEDLGSTVYKSKATGLQPPVCPTQQAPQADWAVFSKDLPHKAIHVDVRNSTSVAFLIQCIEMEYSNMTISILVNSAGILHKITPVVNLTDETFDDVISTNLKGTFLVTKETVKHMLSRNVTGAAIVNIASILGKGGFPGLSAYTASKGGVVAFTKAIAVELATRGIRVNAILPGLTNTPMIQKYESETIKERLRKMIPMQRIAEPLEISETIVFMCSMKTSYMTGSTVDVAGGTML
ncbi:putative 3-oxoacyl-[acyl-carrier-protein] reductase [Ixodes scapularis]